MELLKNLVFGYTLTYNKFKIIFYNKKTGKKMVNKTDKETQEHKQFYENFLTSLRRVAKILQRYL